MKGQQLYRKFSIITILAAQIAAVNAASISEQYSGEGLGELLVGLFNSITVVELASTQDVAIMIGVFAVFYFIELNLVEGIFNTIQGKIGAGKLGSRPRLTTPEGEYPTGTKGLAAAIAFITSQGVAFVLGLWGTAIIGVIGFLMFFIAKFSFLGSFFGGFVPQSVRNGVGRRVENTIAGDNSATDGGQVQQALDEDETEVERDQGEIEDIEDEIEDAEETGDDGEAREAAQREEKVIMSLDDIETDLDQLLSMESQDLQNAIKEAQEVIEQDKREIQGLRSIQGRYERIKSLLQALKAGMRNALENRVKLTNGNLRRTGFTGGGWSYANPDKHGYDTQAAGFKHVVEDLEEAVQQIRQISELEDQEEKEVKDEIRRVQIEAKNFLEALDLINKINTEINEMEQEDKELEQIAKELGDRQLMKLVKKEEKKELNLEKRLDELRNKEDMIRSELEQALKLIDEGLELDQEEIRQIRQELSETNELDQDLQHIRNRYVSNIDMQQGGGGRANANEEVSKAEDALRQIKQGLSSIEQRKEREARILEEVEQNIRQVLSRAG